MGKRNSNIGGKEGRERGKEGGKEEGTRSLQKTLSHIKQIIFIFKLSLNVYST
jgi:hypothetical protein